MKIINIILYMVCTLAVYSQGQGHISAKGVNFRRGPGLKHQRIGIFFNHDKVVIISQSHKDVIKGEAHYWYKVKTQQDITGYVYGKYLVREGLLENNSQQENPVDEEIDFSSYQELEYNYVNYDKVKLRSKPSTSSRTLRLVDKYELVEIINKSDQGFSLLGQYYHWMYVKTKSDNRKGYIFGKYLNSVDEDINESETSEGSELQRDRRIKATIHHNNNNYREEAILVKNVEQKSTPIRTSSKAAETFLLAIGISEYSASQNSKGIKNLKYSHRSAEMLGKLFNAEKEIIILDEAATKAKAIASTMEILQECEANDIFIFTFNGHGNENLLAMNDEQMALDEYVELLSHYQGHKLMLLDACQIGSISATTRSLMHASNVTIFAACQGNQNSYQTNKLGMGVFSNYLCLGMKGVADSNGDRNITYGELCDYVKRRVERYSHSQIGKLQSPVSIGNLSDQRILASVKS